MPTKNLFSRVANTASINIIRHACQLLLGIVIARNLSVEDKGLQYLFTSFSGILAVLLSFGFINSLVYHLKKSLIELRDAKKACLIINLATVMLLFLIILIFKSYFELTLNTEDIFYSEIGALFIIYVIASLNNLFLNSCLLAFSYFKIYFFTFAVSAVASLSIIILGIVYYGFDIVDCLIVLTVIESLSCTIGVCFFFNELKKNGYEVKNTEDTSITKYALSAYLGVSGSTLTSQGDAMILASLLSHESIGIYSVAKTFYRFYIIIPQTINNALFGYLCENSVPKALKVIKKIIMSFTGVSLVVISVSYLFLKDIIVYLYGEPFSVAFEPAIVLVIAASLIAMSASINPLFLAFNQPLTSSRIVLISGFVALSTCVVLTNNYGVVGSASSVLIAAICTFLLRMFYLVKFKDKYI
ncbi:oligosaccharide flippase family protein [Enterovibrio makurazakiensis]|uniref:lipopolysaccharide biosynthesis protein n=1 Tax=Enterovibrio makurazakiensis TaxID=2910232 RepID=UPI003D221214